MPENETEALVDYVDDVLKATSEGKIQWTPINPTTFIWDKPTVPAARLMLQRVVQAIPTAKMIGGKSLTVPEKREMQILTVSSHPPGSMSVTIQGSLDPRINEKLGTIYDSISVGMVEKRLDFLKKTLP